MNQTPQYPPTAVPPGYSPEHPVERLQAIRMRPKRRRRKRGCGCWLAVLLLTALLLAPLLVYLLLPLPVNFVVLGIDRTPEGTALGRSDTIIMVSAQPLSPMWVCSPPARLWVYIPDWRNRINNRHFFAEATSRTAGRSAFGSIA